MFKTMDKYNRWISDFNKDRNKNEVELVTLVHGKRYYDIFAKNYKNILNKVKMSHITVFYFDQDTYNSLKKYNDIKLVKASQYNTNIREMCLNVFIFDVAKHIRSDYYVKIDADNIVNAKCKNTISNILFDGYDIIGHQWNYTKGIINGINYISHLDQSVGKVGNITQDLRVNNSDFLQSFKRHNSYFCIYKTSFIRDIAKYHIDNNNSKLFIPSEDTTTSYFAHIWNKKVKYIHEDEIPVKWT